MHSLSLGLHEPRSAVARGMRRYYIYSITCRFVVCPQGV